LIILGLTGSIGMGKTTAANMFRSLKVAVFDADHIVHNLTMHGGDAVGEVLKAFPDVATNGGVDRQALGTIVFSNKNKLKKLENILHPYVRSKQKSFLATTARTRKHLVVLEIPLLLETGNGNCCDAIVVVNAPATIQKRRVLQRPGMTVERYNSIMDLQIENNYKCRMADFVIQTGLGRLHSLRKIIKIVELTKLWRPRHWRPS
jgi:dephospho-CoA kinase